MYIDESGNSDMGSCNNMNHRFLCLCGIIIEQSYWKGEEVQKLLTSSQISIKSKKMNIPGLQLADLIALPMRNLILEEYKLKKNSEHKLFGDVIANAVKNKIYCRYGKYMGYGLKKLP